VQTPTGLDPARTSVAVIGEALIDLVGSDDGSTYHARPGGSPLNVAVGTARLETTTYFLGRFAPDHFGRVLRTHAVRNGVDLSAAVEVADTVSTLAVATLDERGQARYDFYLNGTADWSWTAADLTVPSGNVGVVHTGSLASWREPGSAAILAFLRELRQRNEILISYDPNVRPSLMTDLERARRQVEDYVASAHVAKVSTDDLDWLYPEVTHDLVAARWLRLGARLVVVTAGADGVRAFTEAGETSRAAPPIELVDTIGAGDAFTAGLLDAIVRTGLTEPASWAPEEGVVASLLDRANLVAAITCSRAGADPPTRAEVAAWLEGSPAAPAS
jgi:fructokinase